jgi:spore coat polysaccharide biosynthesis protein SpsF
MNLGRVGVVVSARTLSSRLPRKALLPMQGMPMVLFLLRRLRTASKGMVMFATTDLQSDDELASVVAREGVPVFRGSCDDLIARYTGAASTYEFDTIARVTGDCPFVDGALVDWCISSAAAMAKFDLATTKGIFPMGLDVEIFRALHVADIAKEPDVTDEHREHLTLYYYHHRERYVVETIPLPGDLAPTTRHFTVDTPADYTFAASLAERFSAPDFSAAAAVAMANT